MSGLSFEANDEVKTINDPLWQDPTALGKASTDRVLQESTEDSEESTAGFFRYTAWIRELSARTRVRHSCNLDFFPVKAGCRAEPRTSRYPT